MGWRTVHISIDVLRHWLTQGAVLNGECIVGLPEDARFRSSYIDNERETVVLGFESPSFSPEADGEPLYVTFQTVSGP